ncbi:MAG: FAD-dependent oxidoreductase [Planctomycetota bacterium]|nr:FAD-dependent oxidoreductase [Planctomycetota bacterium]
MNSIQSEQRNYLDSLPPHLLERAYLKAPGRPDQEGKYVVYWTHHALRTDENPALDVAILLAHRLNLPLLVYQGLSEAYRFASDRHHTFIMEAARDLEKNYAELGIAYALHVDRNGARNPRLAQLFKSAAILVTDDFPIEATKQWTERLSKTNRCPVVLVDTACVVPTRLVGKAYDRAFAFRDATAKLYAERIDRPWPARDEKVSPATLPFDSLRLAEDRSSQIDSAGKTSDQIIANIVSQCAIAHSIGPVADTRGGSEAGYARWNAFRKSGLRSYAKRRNQIEIDGVSRMSAYLHYGMVSPFRIAREASEDGADKYLDELLIWRELAYAFCYYRADLESDASLPAWAVATLKKHVNDARTCLSWETLARAKTGEPLWDAAQRSLLKHGELHNNVRMTWGKAVLEWSADHQESLNRLIDLNHRYALDGRDPASYGGILWCLGQFDRPFQPEQPILGNIRGRRLSEHESRINIDSYVKKVDRSIAQASPRIAMIGTGLAGLMCSRILNDQGLAMKCFEKSNRAGGRISTRISEGITQFDHGAQYFTIRDPVLAPYLDSWCQDKHVAQWNGHIVSIDAPETLREVPATKRFVGTPRMESLAEHLAADLQIEIETEVAKIERDKNGYRLTSKDDRDLGEFDIVLWNCPPKQVERMVPQRCDWAVELSKVDMVPCWAVMIALETRWEAPFDGAFINEGSLAWIARDSSKPSRPQVMDTWVLHSTVAWAIENLDISKEAAIASLTQEAERVTGHELPKSCVARAHRWLYSRPNESLPQSSLWDDTNQVGACGDWCGGPRVEGALKSGIALAGKVLGSLHERSHAMAAPQVQAAKPVQLGLFS